MICSRCCGGGEPEGRAPHSSPCPAAVEEVAVTHREADAPAASGPASNVPRFPCGSACAAVVAGEVLRNAATAGATICCCIRGQTTKRRIAPQRPFLLSRRHILISPQPITRMSWARGSRLTILIRLLRMILIRLLTILALLSSRMEIIALRQAWRCGPSSQTQHCRHPSRHEICPPHFPVPEFARTVFFARL